MTENKRFELIPKRQGQVDIVDYVKKKKKKAICIYNDLGVLPFTSASSLCDLLNVFHEENQSLKEEKELLKNKLDRIEDILPHYLSCAEISEFHSKTFKEDVALMKCWNKRYQK